MPSKYGTARDPYFRSRGTAPTAKSGPSPVLANPGFPGAVGLTPAMPRPVAMPTVSGNSNAIGRAVGISQPGPAGTDTTPAYTARNAGSSMPSLGTANASQPAKPSSFSAALGSMSTAMPKNGNPVTLEALMEGVPQQSGSQPFGGMMQPLLRQQTGSPPEVSNAIRQVQKVSPPGLVPAGDVVKRPPPSPLLGTGWGEGDWNVMQMSDDEVQQRTRGVSPEITGQARRDMAIRSANDQLAAERFNSNYDRERLFNENVKEEDAIRERSLSALGSAVAGLRSGAESQMLQPGQGVPQQPAARKMLKSHIGANGMAYLASDTPGTSPIPRLASSDPARQSLAARPDVAAGDDRGFTVTVNRDTNSPDYGLASVSSGPVVGPNVNVNRADIVRTLPNGSRVLREGAEISPGELASARQRQSDRLGMRVHGVSSPEELPAARAQANQDYQDRQAKRAAEVQAIRTEAAGMQNYGQTGSQFVGMQANPMGGVSPLYAATYGPNMSRTQALRAGREEVQDPTGENRQERYARQQSALRDPTGFLGSQIEREASARRDKIAEGELEVRGKMAQSAQTEAQALADEVKLKRELVARGEQPDLEAAMLSPDPRIRRMASEAFARQLRQGQTQQQPSQTGAGTVLQPQSIEESQYLLQEDSPLVSSVLGGQANGAGNPQAMTFDDMLGAFKDQVKSGVAISDEDFERLVGFAQNNQRIQGSNFGAPSDIRRALRLAEHEVAAPPYSQSRQKRTESARAKPNAARVGGPLFLGY